MRFSLVDAGVSAESQDRPIGTNYRKRTSVLQYIFTRNVRQVTMMPDSSREKSLQPVEFIYFHFMVGPLCLIRPKPMPALHGGREYGILPVAMVGKWPISSAKHDRTVKGEGSQPRIH
jgi:hypothetical protein